MAEAVGAIASIVGIAGAGAKLSIVLFEFASSVGSAGVEARQIGTEISLFCSVLKQLQSTLTKARSYRYSISAIETTQEILDRCQDVFKEIEEIIESLRKRRGKTAEASVDLVARVKWTFKRSHVQMLRTTLESCKITLHIMLTTLEFAQKIATRRNSTIETHEEDEYEQAMTHSLIIAHQCTVDDLERLEDEEGRQGWSENSKTPPPSGTLPSPSTARIVRVPTGNKTPLSPGARSGVLGGVIAGKRTSVWMNNLMFDDSPLPSGFRRQTWGDRECSMFLEQQPYYLLQKWTDQAENLQSTKSDVVEIRREPPRSISDPIDAEITTPPKSQSHFRFEVPADNSSKSGSNLRERRGFKGALAPDSLKHEVSKTPTRPSRSGQQSNDRHDQVSSPRKNTADDDPLKTPLKSPRSTTSGFQTLKESPSMLQVGQRRQTDANGRTAIPPSPDIFESWRISANDTTETILPAALKKYGIDAPWQSFSLWLVCDDTEIQFGMAERPSILLKQLRKDGKNPIFMFRRKEPPLDLNPKRAPPKRPLTTRPGIDKPLPWLPNDPPERSIQEDKPMSNLPSNFTHQPDSNDLKWHEKIERGHDILLDETENQADSDPYTGSLDHHSVTLAEDLLLDSSSPPMRNPEGEAQTSSQSPSSRGTMRKQGNPDTPPDSTRNLRNNDHTPQRYTELQYTFQPISEASPRLPSFGNLQVDFRELETRFAEGNSAPSPIPIEKAKENHVPRPDTSVPASRRIPRVGGLRTHCLAHRSEFVNKL